MSHPDVAADAVSDWNRDWSALDHLPAAVTLWDGALCCRYANPAALQWLGVRQRADVLGRRADSLLPELWQAIGADAYAALAGQLRQVDCTVPGPTGTARWVHVVCSPYQPAGQVRGAFLQVTDVTERVEAEEYSHRLAQEAAVGRERDRIAYQAAHLISQQLFAASLELSAVLQGGAARIGAGSDTTEHTRVRAALRDLNAAVTQLRSLAVPPSGRELLADRQDSGATRPVTPRPRRRP